MRRQIDVRVGWVRLDALLLLACTRAPAPQCPATLTRDVESGIADFAESIDTRMILPRLVRARLWIADGDYAAAKAMLDAALEKARANLGEDHSSVASVLVWRAIALDRQGACAESARERARSEAASARANEPWFAEARAELARLSTCPPPAG
jgi:hypothetical protein